MAQRSEKTLHMVGFGSQAQAWAQCLRASGWQIEIYLSRPEGNSAQIAQELGFGRARPLSDLALIAHDAASDPALIAMLCPDAVIGSLYRDFIAPVDAPVTLILAHGYAVYAHELTPAHASHELAMLAPKAIGPKIWSFYQEARKQSPEASHRLVAGFHASAQRAPVLQSLALAMGFKLQNLVTASFEQEAIGDLLSEQGLLCGGVFTLLEWTLEAMEKAGVPSRLIHEECITELELIAGILRERGPASTFRAISQAAQCGTVAMQETLNRSGARAPFDETLKEVLDERFATRFRSGEWRKQALALTERLQNWQDRWPKESSK